MSVKKLLPGLFLGLLFIAAFSFGLGSVTQGQSANQADLSASSGGKTTTQATAIPASTPASTGLTAVPSPVVVAPEILATPAGDLASFSSFSVTTGPEENIALTVTPEATSVPQPTPEQVGLLPQPTLRPVEPEPVRVVQPVPAEVFAATPPALAQPSPSPAATPDLEAAAKEKEAKAAAEKEAQEKAAKEKEAKDKAAAEKEAKDKAEKNKDNGSGKGSSDGKANNGDNTRDRGSSGGKDSGGEKEND